MSFIDPEDKILDSGQPLSGVKTSVQRKSGVLPGPAR